MCKWKRMRFTLPTTFGDSLTYYEEVCKLRKLVEESIKRYDHCVKLYSATNDMEVFLHFVNNIKEQYTMDDINEEFAEHACYACTPISGSLDIGVMKKLMTGEYVVFGADLMGQTEVVSGIADFVLVSDTVTEI